MPRGALGLLLGDGVLAGVSLVGETDALRVCILAGEGAADGPSASLDLLGEGVASLRLGEGVVDGLSTSLTVDLAGDRVLRGCFLLEEGVLEGPSASREGLVGDVLRGCSLLEEGVLEGLSASLVGGCSLLEEGLSASLEGSVEDGAGLAACTRSLLEEGAAGLDFGVLLHEGRAEAKSDSSRRTLLALFGNGPASASEEEVVRLLLPFSASLAGSSSTSSSSSSATSDSLM